MKRGPLRAFWVAIKSKFGERPLHFLWVLGKIVLAVSVTALSWIASFNLVQHSDVLEKWHHGEVNDITTLLFGAASISLFVFSILIALLAILGWQTLQSYVRERVEEATRDKLKIVENELRGRALSIQGHLLGEMSVKHDTLEVVDQGRLASAVSLCDQGYSFLKEVSGPAKYMGMNNLLYYSCALDQVREGGVNSDYFLLRLARELKEMSLEHRSANTLLTACRAILQYSKREGERGEVNLLLRDLIKDKKVSPREKNEAVHYLRSFFGEEI